VTDKNSKVILLPVERRALLHLSRQSDAIQEHENGGMSLQEAYAVLERMMRAIEHSLQPEPDSARADGCSGTLQGGSSATSIAGTKGDQTMPRGKTVRTDGPFEVIAAKAYLDGKSEARPVFNILGPGSDPTWIYSEEEIPAKLEELKAKLGLTKR